MAIRMAVALERQRPFFCACETGTKAVNSEKIKNMAYLSI